MTFFSQSYLLEKYQNKLENELNHLTNEDRQHLLFQRFVELSAWLHI